MEPATARLATRLRRPDRSTIATAAVLAIVAAGAWVALLWSSLAGDAAMAGMSGEHDLANGGLGLEPGAMEPSTSGFLLAGMIFVGAWVVMMAAMMLPSAAPMVLLYRTITTGSASARAIRTAVFVLAYLVAWGFFGAVVFGVQQVLAGVAAQSASINSAWPFAVAGTLAAAGFYQFSNLKDMCLRQCRSPWSFLMQRWHPGIWGGIELGVRHGVYCIGCCWGLMAVLVIAGAMGLAWVTLVAVVIFAEKLLPPGRAAARVVGGVLLLLAGAVAVMPDLVHRLAA